MKYPRITTLGNIRNADNATLHECIDECKRLYNKSGNANYMHCANLCNREIKRREIELNDLINH